MKPDSRLHRRAGQAGSVILEAMIAILLFSIGILGLIGMQTAAVSNVSDAKYRSDASFLADQVIGQMWASRVSVTNAAGVTSFGIDPSFNYNWTGATAPNAYVVGWGGASGVSAMLPNGSAVVKVDPADPNQQHVWVTITWTPPKAKAGDPPHVHTANAYIF